MPCPMREVDLMFFLFNGPTLMCPCVQKITSSAQKITFPATCAV
jgi:hypothetical protein